MPIRKQPRFKFGFLATLVACSISESSIAQVPSYKWFNAPWVDSEDRVYRELSDKISRQYKVMSVRDVLETADRKYNEFKEDPRKDRLCERLFEVSRWLRLCRNLKGVRDRTSTRNGVSVLIPLWNSTPAPRSYTYCREAFLIICKDTPIGDFTETYKRLVNVNPEDWPVIRAHAFYIFLGTSRKKVPDIYNQVLALLDSIPEKNRIIYDDHLTGVVYRYKYKATNNKEYLRKSIKLFESCVNRYPVYEQNRETLLEVLPDYRKDLEKP